MRLNNAGFLLLKLPIVIFTALLFLSTGAFCQEIADGKYIERYQNGKVKVKGHYKNGVKKGDWFYYTASGTTEKREHWRKGKLTAIYAYNEKGRLASITDKEGQTRYLPDCGCR